MIHAPPSDVELITLTNRNPSLHWTDWFEEVEHHVNEGELPAATQNILADIGIGLSSRTTNIIIRAQSATGGSVDITANPQIEFGFDGQFITIEGMNDTKTVKLDDGNGLRLTSGTSAILKNNDVISFHFNAEKKLWIENRRAIS
jgi:hypothetical protein